MTKDTEIEAKFWKALKSDMTVMLGLSGIAESHSQPMTAQLDEEHTQGPIWFFTSKDVQLVKEMSTGHRAFVSFAAKGHDLFASLSGDLVPDNDRATIDRLWNRFVAAWFKGGKEDPKLQLIRFEPEQAQIWLNENNVFAGIKLLLGKDPKKEYRDKVATVQMH